MKKFTMIAVAVCMAFMLAAPASAAEVTFSGYYKLRGLYNSNLGLLKSDASEAYYKHYFRFSPTIKINDDLMIRVRADGPDGERFGAADDTTGDFDVERVYVTWKTSIGKFDWGTMAGGNWGMGWADYDSNSDRIKYTTKLGDSFTLVGIIEKGTEGDEGVAVADADKDIYWLAGIFGMENMKVALLAGLVNDKTTATQTSRYTAWLPYFKGTFGPVGLEAEAVILRGDAIDYDAAATADIDKEETGYCVEATFAADKFKLLAGYAYGSGDNNAADTEDNSFAYGVGTEHDKLWILANDSFGSTSAAGGIGNLTMGNASTAYGYEMWYASGAFQATDALKLSVLVGGSTADKVPAGWDDSHGTEVDFTMSYKLTDSISYTFIAAYLDPGDFWKQGVAATQLEGNTSIWHNMQVNF